MECIEFKAHLLEILAPLRKDGVYVIEGDIILARWGQRYEVESEQAFLNLLSEYAEEELIAAYAYLSNRRIITLSRDEYKHYVELL